MPQVQVKLTHLATPSGQPLTTSIRLLSSTLLNRMSDSSQTWCLVPTEPASDCCTQAPAVVDESSAKTMTTLANIAVEGERDGTYYWDSVQFLVRSLPADQTIRNGLTRLS